MERNSTANVSTLIHTLRSTQPGKKNSNFELSKFKEPLCFSDTRSPLSKNCLNIDDMLPFIHRTYTRYTYMYIKILVIPRYVITYDSMQELLREINYEESRKPFRY